MTIQVKGEAKGSGRRVAVVVSRYNEMVTSRLVEGATAALRRSGTLEQDTRVVWVPGAWEIPAAVRALAVSREWDGVVALGAIIQGETTHHEHIGREVSASLMRTMELTGVPTSLGILTTDSLDKALARAGGAVGNKGEECVLHLLETLDVLEKIGKQT